MNDMVIYHAFHEHCVFDQFIIFLIPGKESEYLGIEKRVFKIC